MPEKDGAGPGLEDEFCPSRERALKQPVKTFRRALVTNDDGISSEGLHRLAMLAQEAGLEAVVAAPREEASGSSAGLTSVQHEGRVIVDKRDIPALEGVPAYAVSAAPAYIALVGINGAFGDPPDIVLSGVNHGANTGNAILHSGTVGAALTARANGLPALAISLDTGPSLYWDTAVAVAAEMLTAMLASGALVTCNVNAPNIPPEKVRGVRRAPLAGFGAVQTTISETGHGFFRTSVQAIDPSEEPDSDAGLLAQGYATYTFLTPVCESTAPPGWPRP
ncbi:5'/3'-nucleotidase SurE [Actinomadura craniellae]|uniref:5'-nucleotidase n=1 Tax=Actinomadura craniellae TaxID=2231787 RepID=A0A365H9Y4_9ACTN|nr:5'/3'-nucleotidase SurE [Actinomadura craniellae]RAY15905.1 5'/3'-nucleotidase SurE [Actinomadura craniellae]